MLEAVSSTGSMYGARKRPVSQSFVLSMAMSRVLVLSRADQLCVPPDLVMVTLWLAAVSSWFVSVAQSV